MDKDIENSILNEDIKTAVQKLGKKIDQSYHDKNPAIVIELFMTRLVMVDLIQSDGLLWKLISWRFPLAWLNLGSP